MFARIRASNPHRLPDHAPTGSARVSGSGPRRDRGVRPHVVDLRGAAIPEPRLVDPGGAAAPGPGAAPSEQRAAPAGWDGEPAQHVAAHPGDGPSAGGTPRRDDEPSASAALRALLDAVRDDVEGLQARWRDGTVPESAEVDAIAARLATAHEIVLARRRSARSD
jgi:hypothetical protein